jgi:hemerythrin-like domain-containing protein
MADSTERTRIYRRTPDPEVMRDDPLAYLAYDHKAQRALADLLESVADSLPDGVNQASVALAASLLRDSVVRRATLEEAALFPLIEAQAADGSPVRRAVVLARREQRDCAGRAIELAEELDQLAQTGRARNPDALGFMLRAYFDGLRRHLDWIDVAILPHARHALTAVDLGRLGEQFARLRDTAHRGSWVGLAVIEGDRSPVRA